MHVEVKPAHLDLLRRQTRILNNLSPWGDSEGEEVWRQFPIHANALERGPREIVVGVVDFGSTHIPRFWVNSQYQSIHDGMGLPGGELYSEALFSFVGLLVPSLNIKIPCEISLSHQKYQKKSGD